MARKRLPEWEKYRGLNAEIRNVKVEREHCAMLDKLCNVRNRVELLYTVLDSTLEFYQSELDNSKYLKGVGFTSDRLHVLLTRMPRVLNQGRLKGRWAR
jgi:hypothetical protein